jgi:hypothetical protein
MSTSTYRRCGCREDQGKQLGAKCPKLRQKGHGTWAHYVELPTADGKRRQHRRGGFATKKEAEKAAEKVSGRAGGGQVIDDKEKTGQWLESWLTGKRSLRSGTARGYEAHLRLWLIPQLGHIPTEKLRPADITTAYAAIENTKLAKARRKIAPVTIRRIHATLRASLTAAVKQQRLPYNPALHVEPPGGEAAQGCALGAGRARCLP